MWSGMKSPADKLPVVVIGAGFGGLAAAIELACDGVPITLLEAANHWGGKARSEPLAPGKRIDMGPTVLTLRWVFDALFERAGMALDSCLHIEPLSVLARHFWADGTQLDLFSHEERTADAIGALMGAREAAGYRRFNAHAQKLYDIVQAPFIAASRPTAWDIVRRQGPAGVWRMLRIDPLRSMHTALTDYFSDPRLLQLFGRYATYCGGSPYATCATLNLVAHVERLGVWSVEGGLWQLAAAMAGLARTHGAQLHQGARVTRLTMQHGRVAGVQLDNGHTMPARAVILNGGPETLPGLLGQPTPPHPAALSAQVYGLMGRASGRQLQHHNVFFCDDPRAEFEALFKAQRVPSQPTVYLCAPDSWRGTLAEQRLMCLINAPATAEELAPCLPNLLSQLRRCGLELIPAAEPVRTTPAMFARRFPGSDGALYGAPPHSWRSFFTRPGSRAPLPGLYWCGGSVHPGPGVPMAALSGRLAAQTVAQDLRLTRRLHPVATPGGTSMHRATAAPRR